MHHLEGVAGQRLVRPTQRRLGRTEHERQRRPEFVADIAEKCRLGAIDLRQRLGAAARVLQRNSVADGGRNVIGGQLEEVAVLIVQCAAGTDARDEHPVRMVQSRTR